MTMTDRIVGGQLRIGDAELGGNPIEAVLSRIDAAHDLAGLNRLIFLPSRSPRYNAKITEHCRLRGIELYLWYKVLTDNNIHAERNELNVDAWNNRGHGESGVWTPIFDGEEVFRFGCPRNKRYNALLLNRCREALADYDGLYADCIGFPLPSLGLEALFTCFCASCLEAEPELIRWRKRVRELREYVFSASDADLEKWGTFVGGITAFGLRDFYGFRNKSIAQLAAQYHELAKSMGKDFGLDVLSPALADMAGHDLEELGKNADWLKTRVNCRIYGPSSIPLEFHCMAVGMQKWGRRYSMPAVMAFIERSIGIKMPPYVQTLTQNYLPLEAAASEIARSGVSAGGAPVYPGIECSLHPDYDSSGLDEATVQGYLDAARGNSGLILTWNLLFIPDAFLRLVGKAKQG